MSTSMTDILLKERDSSRGFYFPWLPEKIEFESGGVVVASYDVMNRGPVEIPTGTGLMEFSWEGIFPGVRRTDAGMKQPSSPNGMPMYYHNILEDWRKKGTVLNLLVYGYPINCDVIISDYTAKATGAFGDWEYTLKLKEKRELTLWQLKPKATAQATAGPDASAEQKRATATGKTYTIKKGDSPWKIAQQQLGNGARWKEIIELNQEVLEATAKKYGKHCTVSDPHIYAGTVITLPAK